MCWRISHFEKNIRAAGTSCTKLTSGLWGSTEFMRTKRSARVSSVGLRLSSVLWEDSLTHNYWLVRLTWCLFWFFIFFFYFLVFIFWEPVKFYFETIFWVNSSCEDSVQVVQACSAVQCSASLCAFLRLCLRTISDDNVCPSDEHSS